MPVKIGSKGRKGQKFRGPPPSTAVASEKNGEIPNNETVSSRLEPTTTSVAACYTPMEESEVDGVMALFQSLEGSLDKEWEDECAKYEQFETVRNIPGATYRPRRNYANRDGTVQDPLLYPYHTALYPLLDAYDPLFVDTKQPMERNVIQPCSIRIADRVYRNQYDDDEEDDDDDEEIEVEGYTPASVQSTVRALVQESLSPREYECGDFFLLLQSVIDDSMARLDSYAEEQQLCNAVDRNLFFVQEASKDVIVSDVDTPSGPSNRRKKKNKSHNALKKSKYGVGHLPVDARERSDVLLRLLRHSMSELQRDHRLAAAVAVTLMRFRDFDDVDVLRRFLTVCCLEYVPCGCENVPVDHICSERRALDEILAQSLVFGISIMTHQHAVALAGFCRHTFDRETGHLLLNDADETSFEEKQKILVKRNAFIRRADEDEDADFTSSKKVPIDLVTSVVRSLGARGMLERRRLLKALSDPDCSIPDPVLVQSINAYYNCIKALVDVGEAVIKYLPASDRFYPVASSIPSMFCCLLAETELPLFQTGDETYPTNGPVDSENVSEAEEESGDDVASDENPDEVDDDDEDDDDEDGEDEGPPDYWAQRDPNLGKLRLCTESRFADCIAKASQLDLLRRDPSLSDNAGAIISLSPLATRIIKSLLGRPPSEIHQVVRGLFVRDMVNVRDAGCGYGDFCLWCRFDDECTPLDPALFWQGSNFPIEEDYEDDDDEDDEDGRDDVADDEQAAEWDVDENQRWMTCGEVRARYDFSLVHLVREWYAPWTPDRHMSFSREFRRATMAVQLCARRVSLPPEVSLRVLEFLHRDWWPDERRQCWCYKCQEDSVQRYFGASPSQRSSRRACTLPGEVVRCPHCRIATYCSEECRAADWKHDHRKYCNVPPCKLPGAEEERLIARLSGQPLAAANEPDATVVMAAVEESIPSLDTEELVEDDHDEEWEDIESEADEEAAGAEESSRTQVIYEYFRDRSYAPRRIQDSS